MVKCTQAHTHAIGVYYCGPVQATVIHTHPGVRLLLQPKARMMNLFSFVKNDKVSPPLPTTEPPAQFSQLERQTGPGDEDSQPAPRHLLHGVNTNGGAQSGVCVTGTIGNTRGIQGPTEISESLKK